MKRLVRANITLLAPTHKITVPAEICYEDDDGMDAVNTVEIKITYNNTVYQGHGTDYLWVDAFADLQKKLPQGLKLACCMGCTSRNHCDVRNRFQKYHI